MGREWRSGRGAAQHWEAVPQLLAACQKFCKSGCSENASSFDLVAGFDFLFKTILIVYVVDFGNKTRGSQSLFLAPGC